MIRDFFVGSSNESKLGLQLNYRKPLNFYQSGRLDLNQRPPAPKAGALPGCATPRTEAEVYHSMFDGANETRPEEKIDV